MISTIKPFEELEFTDDFMFYQVLQNDEICKKLLERLLKVKIDRIVRQELQKELKPYYGSKGVRLDAYIKDSGRIFNIEMQQVSNEGLPKRTRYYQSMIDADCLLKGSDYEELNESFIIFICKKDPFGADLPVYTFQNICAEKSRLALNDGAKKFFFNAASAENEKDLAIKAFLNYIKCKEPQDPLTEQIEECVERIRLAEASKGAYMFESLRIRDSIMAGKKMGREEMGVESAKNFYANGVSVEIIAKSLGMTEEQVKEIVSGVEATA